MFDLPDIGLQLQHMNQRGCALWRPPFAVVIIERFHLTVWITTVKWLYHQRSKHKSVLYTKYITWIPLMWHSKPAGMLTRMELWHHQLTSPWHHRNSSWCHNIVTSNGTPGNNPMMSQKVVTFHGDMVPCWNFQAAAQSLHPILDLYTNPTLPTIAS